VLSADTFMIPSRETLPEAYRRELNSLTFPMIMSALFAAQVKMNFPAVTNPEEVTSGIYLSFVIAQGS